MYKKIWIDITNAPHVLFFEPLIKELKKKNKVAVTARNIPSITKLLDNRKIKHVKLGRYWGKSLILKTTGTFFETFQRIVFGLNEKPDLIVSHQSPYASVSSFFLRKPCVFVFDNENAVLQNYLGIGFATRIICPDVIPDKKIRKFPGFRKNKIVKYGGIKEGIYLHDFRPDKRILKKLGLKEKRKIVVMRPEPYSAQYYAKGKDILSGLINEIIEKTGWQVVVLPRDKKQKELYENLFRGKITLAEGIDSSSLIHYSDLFVGAGGTMNREAAVLGTPVISTYSGKLLEVDKWLIKEKLIQHNKNPSLELLKKTMSKRKKSGRLKSLGRKSFEKIFSEIG